MHGVDDLLQRTQILQQGVFIVPVDDRCGVLIVFLLMAAFFIKALQLLQGLRPIIETVFADNDLVENCDGVGRAEDGRSPEQSPPRPWPRHNPSRIRCADR